MKTQESFHDLALNGFLMSENPMAVSDLLLGGHITGYGHHFEKINSAGYKYRF